MFLPPWLTFTCAALIVVWGAYRVKVGLRSEEAEARATAKKGLYAMPRRTHLLIGVVYVLLGVSLAAIGFGWRPFDVVMGGGAQSTHHGGGGTEIELGPTAGSQSPHSAPTPSATP